MHHSLPRLLLNVVPRTRIVPQPDDPRESVQAVTNGDIERFSEDAIPLLGVGDDLGVPARDVEDDGVVGGGDLAAHLDV
jgi:hypothetical protein